MNISIPQSRTKIIATLGPVSESTEVIRQMILAGADMFRLNLSHNTLEWHSAVVTRIRSVAAELGTPTLILADLQGPRVRVVVNTSFITTAGESVPLYANPEALHSSQDTRGIALDTPGLYESLVIGERVLIRDGQIALRVTAVGVDSKICQVLTDGEIEEHKNVILPDTKLSLPALTAKDMADAAWAVGAEVDFVGLSFVGSAEDVEILRNTLTKVAAETGAQKVPKIVAKIERRVALEQLVPIVEATDMVMVARGDLGVEMPLSEVVLWQKEIIHVAKECGKESIVATQMLQSMVHSATPTRAEVGDVTNAVLDLADAVMLSDETAVGQYPIEAVAAMEEIVNKTESWQEAS